MQGYPSHLQKAGRDETVPREDLGRGRPGRCHEASQMPLVDLTEARTLLKVAGQMFVVKVREAVP